ncbi:MAG: ATP-binding protein [bacterium]
MAGEPISHSSPTLLSYVSGLFNSLEVAAVYRSLVVLGAQLMEADAAVLFGVHFSDTDKQLTPLLANTPDLPDGFINQLTTPPAPGTNLPISQSAVSKLAKGFRITTVSDVLDTSTAATSFDRQLYLDYGYRSFIVAPIVGKSELLVVLILYFPTAKTLSKPELSGLSTFCREAGIAIENARKYADAVAVVAKSAQLAKRLHSIDLDALKSDEVAQHLKQFEALANVGMLAASVSHEVNNSLDAIKNYIYLVSAETAADNPHKEYLKIVETELERTGKIMRQLLDLYKPTKAPMQEINVNEIIEQTVLLIGKPLRQKQYTVIQDLDKTLPAVKGVPDQLKQVFLNLFFNAIQAMPTGGELKITTQIDSDNPNQAEIGIADTGVGIPDDKLNRIFEPFYTTKQGGTGLGLAVCRQIIRDHNGDIAVDSKLNQGTTFHIYLPLYTKQDKANEPPAFFEQPKSKLSQKEPVSVPKENN